MAGSNWDYYTEGRPLTDPRTGFKTDVYKNHLDLDKEVNIAQIEACDMFFGDLHIVAEQLDDPSGVMFLVTNINTHRQYAGVGCYAWEGSCWVGVPQAVVEKFKKWCREQRK